jgi:Dockerin type I domain
MSRNSNKRLRDGILPKLRKRSGIRLRKLLFETLDSRVVFSAEGSAFAVDKSIDATGLLGNLSATANWGDGNSSTISVTTPPSAGPLRSRIDYSLDTSNFFNTTEKRNTLQNAIDSVLSRFSDTLQSIIPAGVNSWTANITHPSTGNQKTFDNLSIAANEILIFAGARDLPGNDVGRGGPGGFAAGGTAAWVNTVTARGQTGALSNPATDSSLWGGQLAFDSPTKWHFGESTTGLDPDETDFYSVAVHEFAHLMGFGIKNPDVAKANAWERFLVGNQFAGPLAKAQYDSGGNIPLESDQAHWLVGITDDGQATVMDPSISKGTRKLLTPLDLAAFGDLGWQRIIPTVRLTGEHVYGDNGTFPVSITVRGSRVGERTVPITASVTNVTPTLAPRVDTTAHIGQVISITNIGSFSDPGFGLSQALPPVKEEFEFEIDWGDGSPLDKGTATIDKIGSAGVLTLGSFDGSHTYDRVGKFTVKYSVADDNGGRTSESFRIEVLPEPALSVTVDRSQISENAGSNAATLTVRRTGLPVSQQLTIELTSSDTSELKLPATAVFPANVSEINVPIEAVDDDLLDGLVRVQLRAKAGTVQSNDATVDVLDFEAVLVELSVARINENEGANAAQLTVRRTNTDRSNPLTVTLRSTDTSEANLVDSIVIPANQASVQVGIDAIDDVLLDGLQSLLLTAQATGYMVGQVALEVDDFEPIIVSILIGDVGEAEPKRKGRASIQLPAAVVATGGLKINLVSDSSSNLSVPSQVVIAQGSAMAEFEFTVINDFKVEGPQAVQLTAMSTGYVSTYATVTIEDDDLPLWQNPGKREDVNNNGTVTPLDALLIINRLNQFGIGPMIPGQDPVAPPYLDASGNGIIEPLDALLIINELNRQ